MTVLLDVVLINPLTKFIASWYSLSYSSHFYHLSHRA